MNQMHIKGRKVELEAEAFFFHANKAYGRPVSTRALVGSVIVGYGQGNYPVHTVVEQEMSQTKLVDISFLFPECVLPFSSFSKEMVEKEEELIEIMEKTFERRKCTSDFEKTLKVTLKERGEN